MKRAYKFAIVLISLWLFVVWIGYMAKPSVEQAFARYIYSPVPNSVSNLLFEGNDWFGLTPEPVCYFSFSASRDDLMKIAKKFEKAPVNEMFSPGGPPWFRPTFITNGEYFRRLGKRGREYLWIDQSGTNAYFLLFGV